MESQKVKLTETTVKAAPPDAKLWDTEIKGFGLFTGKTTKTFLLPEGLEGQNGAHEVGHMARDARSRRAARGILARGRLVRGCCKAPACREDTDAG